ncbi:L-seryl-tRNA(Sec) kinase-like isoform X1 [Stegodyphus dumicola]|uniref:L-seryl-tRNA(Sec) kinase-like isoform X1 n=2 Tax=Stegodyphus dumicola TaxID=202533 RepID=UPI0015AC94A9|nr:L-seryl-tRNA(Sec) kinase-like isoform X1 [Stegodyphus dumicola]
MSCIVLVGGGVGCGKTRFINFFQEHKNVLFCYNHEESKISSESAPFEPMKGKSKILTIIFDDLCSIDEQVEMMQTIKGWRNFRIDLLMAAERFICMACGSECNMAGPLTERSYKLLKKLESLNEPCSNIKDIIIFIEDNFYYRSMRYDWFQIAKRANIGFCQVFLQCALNTAIHRNSIRGYHIPEDRIKRMLSCMEYPDSEKYKWEKYSIVFDSSLSYENSPVKDVVNIIKEATNNPAEIMVTEDKIEAQRICSKNAIHQADKILRKLISKKILDIKENLINEDMKMAISTTVNLRQQLLNDLRQGNISIPKELITNIQKVGIECVQNEYEQYLSKLFENIWRERTLQMDIINLKLNL